MGDRILIDRIEQQTGRSIAEWVQIVRESGIAVGTEAIRYLQYTHGIFRMYALVIVRLADVSLVEANTR